MNAIVKMTKSLIAYYSRKGNNYTSGKIVNLSVGNTAVIALKIHELTGGELFEIKTVKTYPADYTETTEVSRIELKNNARPELSDSVKDMESYNVVYLGYPNWWGTMPMALYTFLESYSFSGKTIISFCTHEGSGMGKSEKEIQRICAGSIVLKGLAIHGSSVSRADSDIKEWLKNHNLI